ncbi:unnamed protein product [Polarella glacialis]|uniref:Importin N-terminal domain-containing protein n=1 Tax=Polarella glacialis TaxID=89957 RepID=A0A813GGD1_POLGL|nr:unnamed protein product [Polarella glacialis]
MQADPELLYKVFRQSYSAVAEERQQAEAWLQQAQESPNLLPALLQIAVARQADPAIRQAASIQLKNQVRKYWAPSGDDTAISGYKEADKVAVRAGLIEGVAASTDVPSVRAQMLECFRLIVLHDFPDSWPGLVDKLLAGLQSDDTAQTHCGLLLLRRLYKQLESRPVARREALESLCVRTLPTLRALAPALASAALAFGGVSPQGHEAYTMLKLVLKCFYSAVHMAVAEQAKQDIEAWMSIVLGVAEISMGPAPSAGQLQAREAGVDAKCRKWAFHILFRFFHRHGHVRRAVDGAEAFAEEWSSKYEVPVAEVCLKEACAQQRGTWASKRTLSLALLCVADAVSRDAAFQGLKPGLQHLLQYGIFPQVRFAEQDMLLWQEDPEEYVRQLFNDLDSFSAPRAAAVELVERLLLHRKKDVMVPLLQFCQHHLEAQAQKPSDPELCANKDGALVLLAAMGEQIIQLDPAQGMLWEAKKKKKSGKAKSIQGVSFEELLARHVRPELSGPVAFLRLRACWVYEKLADKAPRLGPPGAAGATCRECLQLAADPELPVRVVAVTCLQTFLQREGDEEVRAVVSENLGALLERLLKILAEIQCEEVSQTLQCLVDSFPHEIVPFAAQLIAQLAAQFCQATAEGNNEEEDTESAAMGSMSTIVSVLQACSGLKNPEDIAEQQRRAALFSSLAESLLPLVSRLLHPDGIDFLEESLEMLTYLTAFCPSPIPAQLWGAFPRLYQAVCGKSTQSLPLPDVLKDGWAPDFMCNLVQPMLNYMARGPTQVFLSGTWAEAGMTYPDMLFDMVRKVVHTPGIGAEENAGSSVELAAALFEHTAAPGVDNWLPRYFEELWRRLPTAETAALRRATLLAFATMIWYNAALFLRCAEEKSCTVQVFEFWMQRLNLIRSPRDRKVVLLAKLRLFQLGCGQALPGPVAQGLPHLVRKLAEQSKELMRLRQKQGSAAGSDSEEEDDSDADGEGGARANRLKQVLGKLEMAQDNGEESADEDDDDDDDPFNHEGGGYDDDAIQAQRKSLLDRTDELELLRQTLQQAPPAMQQQVESWIGSGLQQWLAELSAETARTVAAAATRS